MVRPATQRLKVNPPLGMMPALQYLLPEQLKVDPAYQRTLDTGPSQALIRRIAVHWNWDLCQPLVVAMREGGELFVIDGQHRLEAARLRGDIQQLPAVVVRYASAADEAASFVHLNQQRRPLSKLDVFKAAVASEDPEAVAIAEAIAAAGPRVVGHGTFTTPDSISNIGGLEQAYRRHGAAVLQAALEVLREAWPGQVLKYAGTVFPGIAAVCAAEMRSGRAFDPTRRARFVVLLASRQQQDWRDRIGQMKLDNPNLKYPAASRKLLLQAWEKSAAPLPPEPVKTIAAKGSAKVVTAPPRPKVAAVPPPPQGPVWCGQCEQRVQPARAMTCSSPFCKVKPQVAA